jgi:hypothetical protein
MFELVRKMTGARRLFSAVVAAATLATVTSIGGVASAAAVPQFNAPPSAPLYVQAFSGDGQVTLCWNQPYYTGGGAQFFGYNVYQGTAAGGESATPVNGQVPTQNLPNICDSSGNYFDAGFVVGGLTDGTTYYFTVKAVNVLGMSPASAEVSAVPAGPPGAPTAVTAVATSGQVVLTWTAPASTGGSPILGYNVYCDSAMSNGACIDGTFYTADAINGSTLVSGTTYTITGLRNGSSYTFDVAADNAVGEGTSGVSNTVIPTGQANQPEYPRWAGYSPTSITMCVTPPQFAGGSGDNWFTNGGSAILGYDYYIGTTPGGESSVPQNGAATPAPSCYTFTGLNPGTVYFMKAAAVTAAGVGTMSQEIQRETNTTVPSAPQTPSATVVDGPSGAVTFSWTAPASDGGRYVSGYNLYYCDNATPTCTPVAYGSNPISGTSVTVTGLTSGDPYLWYVTAINPNGESAGTTTGTFTVQDVVPSAPTLYDVQVTASTTASVCWNASTYAGNTGGIIGYNIYDGTAPGAESATPLNGTPFPAAGCQTVVGLTPGTTYYFTVKAVNSVGTSAASNEVNVTANGSTPGAPTGLSVAAGDFGSGTLVSSWTAPLNGGDTITNNTPEYQICVSTTSGSEYSVPAGYCWTFNATTNTFNPNLLFATGTKVYLAVRARNTFGYGPWSAEANYTVPSTPGAVTVTATNYAGIATAGGNNSYPFSGYVNLSWTTPSGIGTGFTPVEYVIVDVTDSCTVAYTTDTSYVVTGWQYGGSGLHSGGNCGSGPVLDYGYSTMFQVYAINAMGNSAASAPVSVISGTIPDRPHDSTWGVASVGANSALVVFNFFGNSAAGRSGYNSFDAGGPGWVDAGVTSFKATAWVGSTPWSSCTFTVGSPSNPFTDGCQIAGLPNNTFFTVTLQMSNALGTGYIDTDGFIAGTPSQAIGHTSPFTMENWATTGAAPIVSVTSLSTTMVRVHITDPSVFRNNFAQDYYVVASLNSAVNASTGAVVCGENESIGVGGVFSANSYTYDATGLYCDVNLSSFPGWSAGTPVTFAAFSSDSYNDVDLPYDLLSPESNMVTITPASVVPDAPTIVGWGNGLPNWQVQGNNSGWTGSAPGLAWTDVLGNGYAGVAGTGYNVYIGTASGAESSTPVNGSQPLDEGSYCGSGYCSLDLFYLTPGTTYYVIVKAVNGVGSSTASNEITITPPLVPSAPLNLVGTPGDHSVTLSWNPPTTLGTTPFMGYYVYAGSSPNGEGSYPVNSSVITGTSYTVTGLTNGSPYYFYVVAANAAGLSPAAFGEEISVTPQSKAATSTHVTLSAKTAKLHHEGNVRVHVSVTGAPVSGTVTIKWTTRTVCTVTLVNGAGSCMMGANSVNKLGLRTLVATYPGDAGTLGSVGKVLIRIHK